MNNFLPLLLIMAMSKGNGFSLDTLMPLVKSLGIAVKGKEYFTLKDIFIEERRKILQTMLKGKLKNFANTYESMYNEGKGSIYQMQNLELQWIMHLEEN